MNKYFFGLLILLLGAMAPSLAASQERSTEFSIGAGVRIFESKIAKYIDSTDGALELHAALRGPIIQRALFWDLGVAVGAGGESGSDGTSMFSYAEGRLGLSARLPLTEKLQGMLNGGVALISAKLKADRDGSDDEIDASGTGVGPYVAAGLLYYFNEKFGLSGGLSYTYCRVDFDGVKANAGGPGLFLDAVFRF